MSLELSSIRSLHRTGDGQFLTVHDDRSCFLVVRIQKSRQAMTGQLFTNEKHAAFTLIVRVSLTDTLFLDFKSSQWKHNSIDVTFFAEQER